MKSEEERWEKELRGRGLTRSQETWYRRTIQWFLGYCRKQRPPLSPNRTTANYFYSQKVAERKPPEWQKQQWREAIGLYLDVSKHAQMP